MKKNVVVHVTIRSKWVVDSIPPLIVHSLYKRFSPWEGLQTYTLLSNLKRLLGGSLTIGVKHSLKSNLNDSLRGWQRPTVTDSIVGLSSKILETRKKKTWHDGGKWLRHLHVGGCIHGLFNEELVGTPILGYQKFYV